MNEFRTKSLDGKKIHEIRKSLELTQEAFAKELGVTKITVARWESGERTCKSAHAENVIKLEQTRYNHIVRGVTTIFSVRPDDLSRMESKEALRAIRDLLWCKCRRTGIPINDTDMCEAEIKDGGIDLRINARISTATDDILPGLNCFQVKSGKSKKPSEKWILEELFKSVDPSKVLRTNLGTEVQRCLDEDGRYVLVFSGLDMTGKQISECENFLRKHFKTCGYTNAKVEVWSQQKLIGMFSAFPSLCLQITKRDDLCFKDYLSWKMESNMQRDFHPSQDINLLIQEIRTHLYKTDPCHIRLIGPSGVGKTRLALETLSHPDLAPLIVYISDSEDFHKTQLFNKLCRSDSEYFIILVLDNCSPQRCKEIWNSLYGRSNRCKIISIYEENYRSNDLFEHVFTCPILDQSGIQKIIEHYIENTHDLTRWTALCGGLPLMAHILGKELYDDPERVLREPSLGWIWEKYIKGRNSDENTEHRRVVLEYISLFKRFGFEGSKKDESEFIYKLIRKRNPNIGLDKFQSIIVALKKEGILKGSTTLHITPELLHLYLYRCFWESRPGFISKELIETMPSQLASWFWQMFSYAPSSQILIHQIDELLDLKKPLYPSKLFNSRESDILNHLSSAFPGIVLGYIKMKLDKLSRNELLSFTEGRQDLVWSLEKILWREEFFEKAVFLLLRLAEAENATNSNNSKGTFVRIFSLIRGAAPTTVSFEKRMEILKFVLFDSPSTTYEVGLEACKEALSIYSKPRLIGPEYQGLQKTFLPWVSKTLSEHREQYKIVWDLLVRSIKNRSLDERTKAILILIQSGKDLLRYEEMQQTIFNTFESLIDDEATDLPYFLFILTELIRRKFEKLAPEVLTKLKELERKITGTTFHSRLRRWVFFATCNDNYNDEEEDGAGDQQIKLLASEAISNIDLLKDGLTDLVMGKNMAIFELGKCLGQRDKKRELFTLIKNSYTQNIRNATWFFFSGYLKAIFELNPAIWEVFIDELVRDNSFCKFIGVLVRESGFTDASLEKLFREYEKERLEIECLSCFRHSSQLKVLRLETIQTLVRYLLKKNKCIDALKILKRIYGNNKKSDSLPEELTYQVLKDVSVSASVDTMCDYDWNHIADSFISQFPDKSCDIFESILDRICHHGERFFSSEIIKKIIDNDPPRCWFLITSKLSLLNENSVFQFIQGCKSNRIDLSYFPLVSILNWVAECPKYRASIIAQMVSPILKENCSDCLVRELLNRYPKEIENVLLQKFLSGMWIGSESAHFENKCNIAKQWLQTETSMRVREWLKKYIDILSKLVEEAKIREERLEF